MMPQVTVRKVFEDLSGLRKALQALTEQDVYIGIPAEETAREAGGEEDGGNSGISNAALGYIQEFGAPEKNIPARPHLVPGIEDIRGEAAEILASAAKQALEGNAAAVERGLNRIGMLGQNAVRARFADNDWPELAPATLAARARAGRKGINPLIDTGQLRKAYTYVVRKKGNQALVVK